MTDSNEPGPESKRTISIEFGQIFSIGTGPMHDELAVVLDPSISVKYPGIILAAPLLIAATPEGSEEYACGFMGTFKLRDYGEQCGLLTFDEVVAALTRGNGELPLSVLDNLKEQSHHGPWVVEAA